MSWKTVVKSVNETINCLKKIERTTGRRTKENPLERKKNHLKKNRWKKNHRKKNHRKKNQGWGKWTSLHHLHWIWLPFGKFPFQTVFIGSSLNMELQRGNESYEWMGKWVICSHHTQWRHYSILYEQWRHYTVCTMKTKFDCIEHTCHLHSLTFQSLIELYYSKKGNRSQRLDVQIGREWSVRSRRLCKVRNHHIRLFWILLRVHPSR